MSTVPAAYLTLAGELADAARAIVRRRFRTPLAPEYKGDGSPVTAVDREVEAALRELLRRAVPEHGILGEEEGGERLDARLIWALDPIDGTRAFMTGKPLFGTLVSLFDSGRAVLGVLEQPVLEERWLGREGGATTFNGAPCRVRASVPLSEAVVYAGNPAMFEAPQLARLREATREVLYDCDCYAYGLLALGLVDAVVECSLQAHDWGPLVPIVRGAGGYAATWSGAEPTLDADGTLVAATQERLGRAVAEVVAG